MALRINWRRVLHSAGIEFIERGANVKRGEINIRCPFCGNSDPSHHLGIAAETTGWWACWRNQNHRGKSPVRLLVKLLRCSLAHAREIAGLSDDYIDPDGFDAVAMRLLHAAEEVKADAPQKTLVLPNDELNDLRSNGSSRRHWEYLVYDRYFLAEDLPRLMHWYGVSAVIRGRFRERVMLPYIVGGELVAWTARAIAPAQIRYLDLKKDECLIEPKHTLYNHDVLLDGGQFLVVVEGPFDALKIDLYGRDWGVRAVALSTNSISDDQIYLLEEGASHFSTVLVMMDNAGALGVVDSMKMRNKLSQIRNLSFCPVPFGKKDAGELRPSQVLSFARTITT